MDCVRGRQSGKRSPKTSKIYTKALVTRSHYCVLSTVCLGFQPQSSGGKVSRFHSKRLRIARLKIDYNSRVTVVN